MSLSVGFRASIQRTEVIEFNYQTHVYIGWYSLEYLNIISIFFEVFQNQMTMMNVVLV